MAAQTIDKAMLDAYFDQLLVEKKDYFKDLIREILEEKLAHLKSNKEASVLNSIAEDSIVDTLPSDVVANGSGLFERAQLTPHFEKILKEDHHLLLRLAQ